MSGWPQNQADSPVDLVSDVAAGIGRLVKGELMLARAEAAEAVKGATGGAVKIALALVVGLVGLNVLAGAVVAGLASSGMGAGPAGLAVAVVLFGLALILWFAGRSAFRPKGLLPRRTMQGLKMDAHALRAGLNREGAHHV